MKRPSNIVLGFILAIAASFLTWIGWLVFANVIQSPEVEVEEGFKPQLEEAG